MASYNNFQQNNRKYAKTKDLSKRPANLYKSREKSVKERTNFARWIYLYRKNIDIFCEIHFGVRLYLFQKFWLYELGNSESYVCTATRGISKSFIIALFGCALATLYPKSEIVICAKNKVQAGLIITEKIEGYFMSEYPNIAIEIKKVIANSNKFRVVFHNGSTITVVPGTDGARGKQISYSKINSYENRRNLQWHALNGLGMS